MSTKILTYTEYFLLNNRANRAVEAERQVGEMERRISREQRENEELRRRITELRNQQPSHSTTVGMLADVNENLRNQLAQANQRLREAEEREQRMANENAEREAYQSEQVRIFLNQLNREQESRRNRAAELLEISEQIGQILENREQTIASDLARRSAELEQGCQDEAKIPDYWNRGAFSELRNRQNQVQQELEQFRDQPGTREELDRMVIEVMTLERQLTEAVDEAERQIARYFDSIVGAIETLLEVLGDEWECTRYGHSVEGDLTSPVEMVFQDQAGHELPMLLDIIAHETSMTRTRLEMAVVGAGVETSGEDAQITLDDITNRLQEHGLHIGSSETDLSNCDTVARTADTYFEDRRRRAQAKE